MKILLVHDFYRSYGGEDAVALAESELLQSRVEHLLVYQRNNSEIDDYGLLEKLAFPGRAVYCLRTSRDIAAIARNFQPNFAYVHNIFPLISPSLYLKLHSLKIPSLQVMHDFRLFCPNGWFYTDGQICEKCKHGNYLNSIRYRCYRDSYSLSALYALSIGLSRAAGVLDKISGFICLTEFTRHKLLEAGIPESKLFIRPNFINPRISAAKPGSGDYVLYVGRLSAEKGLWTLLKAFEQLKGVSLKIMGTGPLETDLRSYIKERHIRNVEFLGFKQGNEKWATLRNCLFVIVPSEWYETFCMVALEAYVAGKPVLASNLGSLPYVVEHNRSGLLFEAGNVQSLVESVRYLVGNASEIARMGIRGRELAVTKYSPSESYQRLIEIAASVQ